MSFTQKLCSFYTEKCRFMDKRVREISRSFVAPPRAFPLSVWAARNHTRTHKFTRLSILNLWSMWNQLQLPNSLIGLHYRDYPSAPPSGLDTRPLVRRREIRPGPQPRRLEARTAYRGQMIRGHIDSDCFGTSQCVFQFKASQFQQVMKTYCWFIRYIGEFIHNLSICFGSTLFTIFTM